jgi:HB1, ASXL, restriction endonuclease HTH domain
MSAKKRGKTQTHTSSKKRARFPRIEAALAGRPLIEAASEPTPEAASAETAPAALDPADPAPEVTGVEDPTGDAVTTGQATACEATSTDATLLELATADAVVEPLAGAAKSTEALAEAMGEAPVAQSPTQPPTVEVVEAEVEGTTQDAATPTPTGTIPESSPVARETERPKKLRKARAAKAAAEDGKVKKVSALDAAAKVLGEAGQPMGCKEMIGAMAAKGYWSSPGGKTPETTLYSALLRELNSKGEQGRFVKADRGKFGLRQPG